jgi:uncharacterized protein (DUF427 family)
MARAVFNGTVIADSTDTKVVEGNVYFPPESIRSEHLTETDRTTVCHWKGTASYYDVEVDGERADGVAWYYPDPSNAAEEIRDHVAFDPKVAVET